MRDTVGEGALDGYDRSSDFALLEAQFRLLHPNAREGPLPFSSSSSPSPSYVVLISVLSPNAWLTHPFFPPLPYPYLPTSPRPQFPPILFSKQVCKTQFSRRLTSHLIARWNTVSPLLFSLFILPAIVAFIFPSPCIARVSLLSCTNNAILSLCTPASTITVTRRRFSKDRGFEDTLVYLLYYLKQVKR